MAVKRTGQASFVEALWAAVETTFATLKCRMRLSFIRYVGLNKAAAQVLMAAIAFNLRRWAAITP